jgi:hypothetical protein
VNERLETTRDVAAPAADVFALLCDPQGHVAIDSSGMLQDATGSPVAAVGDTFVVHMDRESLGDIPEMGTYDVTVVIERFEADREIAWSIIGTVKPPIGHVYGYSLAPLPEGGTRVTTYYDWSGAREEMKAIFPIIPESALKATLGILDRTVRRGYARG